jgi:tetratricopeptide (TPR) repeat protein
MKKKSSLREHGPQKFGSPSAKSSKVTSWFTKAIALHQAGRLAEAEKAYRKILAIHPDHIDSLHLLGVIFLQRRNHAEALRQIDLALKRNPNNSAALDNRGVALKELKRFEAALASHNRAIALQPNFAEAFLNRGNVLRELKRFREAIASYDRALMLRPNYAEALSNRGNVLRETGQLAEAQATYLKALQLSPNVGGIYVNLADWKTFKPGDPYIAAMESLLAKGEGLSKIDRMHLDFALGKAYADLKDYRRSFSHLLAGNAAKRTAISYDERSTFVFFDRLETVFTHDLIATRSGGGDASPMPIFVLGMPRSGTTLVEQIIASHPMVHGAGESQTLDELVLIVRAQDSNVIQFPEFVPDLDTFALREFGDRCVTSLRTLAQAGEGARAERVTDKTLSNYYFAGLIHLALPNAKIIHTIRDPFDTCISCFSKLFATELKYAYDLGELGRYHKRYERLMKHWHRVLPPGRILDVRYEEVVADLEGQARRIISYCGLDWDDRCLSFHKTDRPVLTASATQVRQPIYRSAIGRWRDYEEHLGPLLSAHGIAPGLGYDATSIQRV